MTRIEFEGAPKTSVGIRRFFKPDLWKVTAAGRTIIVKDARHKHLLARLTLGWCLIQREWSVYARLVGVDGVPRALERIDRFAFALEFVSARPIASGDTLPSDFLANLARILEGIHSRGVVHLDLRHRGNILVSETGKPIVIDYNSSIAFRPGSLCHRILFPLLQRIDRGGFLKLKARLAPDRLTPEERVALDRFRRWRRLWIFDRAWRWSAGLVRRRRRQTVPEE